MNMFEEMLVAQHDLQTRVYGYDFAKMTDQERVQYIKDMMLGIQAELKEMLDEVNWKPWTTETGINNVEAYLGEAVDVWHFLMNLLLATGAGPFDLTYQFYQRYHAKAKLNAERQAVGYDGRTGKCSECKRALDDPAVNCYAPTERKSGWCEPGGVELRFSYVGTKCHSCGSAIGDANVGCTRRGDQGHCAVRSADVNYVKTS